MLRYFRINDPYRLLALLALLLVIYLPLLIDAPEATRPELKSILLGEKVHEGSRMYLDVVDQAAPLAGWFDAFFDMLFGRSLLARHILGMIIVLMQATYLGIVFINKKAFSESTFIPSLLFIILFSFSYDTMALSSELLGAGLLLLALNNLFKEIEFREQRDESIFNLGLFISLASLFSFSFVIYIFAAVVILAIYTRLELRKYLLLIFGFLLPHFFMIAVYYLRDGLEPFMEFYYRANLGFDSTTYLSTKSLWMLGALPLLYLLISFVILNREARFTKYQSQLVQAMFFWMVFAVLQILYSKELRPQSFIPLIPGFCFYLCHFLLLIRRRRFAEMNLWVLLVGIVGINYFARYDLLPGIDYRPLRVGQSEVPVSGKRILMLGDSLSVYTNNTPAPAFLDWGLTQQIFTQPDYYENVIRVSDAFRKDPPDIIFDPGDLMPGFFARIPALQAQYVRVGKGEYHLKLNTP